MKPTNEKELRELDAWIAENVFGWEWMAIKIPSPNGTVVRRAIFFPEGNGWIRWRFKSSLWHKADGTEPLFEDWDWEHALPHYTTDQYSAMEVLKKCDERLSRDCQDIAIGQCPGMDWCGGDYYLYSIFRENRSEIGQWRVNGPTREIAICLFAKKLFSVTSPTTTPEPK